MKRVTIVSPVYNEEEVIEDFYRELKKETSKIKDYQFDYLFVVDKSKDKTLEIIRNLAKENKDLKCILLSRRFGHQASLIAGLDHCMESDVVIMMDSDLQHPPQLIGKMIEKYEEGSDIVFTIRDDSYNVGYLKRKISKLFYLFINKISDVYIHPESSDFRLISNKVLHVFRTQIREQNQFLRGLFSWVGFTTTTINFVTGKRIAGKSKYSFKRMLGLALDGVLSFSIVPLRLSVLAGIGFASGSLLYTCFILFKYMQSEITVPGWTSVGLLVSFLGGIQLIFLGVIGEYIGGIFQEVKQRPLYIIESKINMD